LQHHRIGLVSGEKIYFDIHKLNLLGDFSIENWHDTLNCATSDDNINYEDQRDHLQQVLDNMRMETAQAIMAGIDQAIIDAEIQANAEDDLTDYEDFYDDDDQLVH
jgi:hypothetical protein